MRCSQPQGLPTSAEEFLFRNAVRLNRCQRCFRNDGYQKEVIGTCGMSDDVNLYKYTLSNGDTADEYVQHEAWDSGQIIWLGLKCKDKTFEWTSLEIWNEATK